MENTMPMTTNDIRILALLLDIEPKFLSVSDDKLLALVYHECAHRAQLGEGRFKAFYDSLPNDIAIKFMVDRRTLEWMLENKCHFITDTNKPTLAERLERGVDADIWYDLSGDDGELGDAIDDTQAAMLEAAKLLREHGLDK
jgi:hypothetical protein